MELSEYLNQAMRLGHRAVRTIFITNDITAAAKKRALLSVCGPATYQLIRNLVAPCRQTHIQVVQRASETCDGPPPANSFSYRSVIHLNALLKAPQG